MNNNRKILVILLIVVAIAGAAFGGYKIYSNQKAKMLKQNEINQIQEAIIKDATAHQITDLKITNTEKAVNSKGSSTGWYVVHATSEQFGKLSEQEKVDFFKDLSRTGDYGVWFKIYCEKESFADYLFGGLRITSDGHEYMSRFDDGWILYQDGKEVYKHEVSGNGSSNGNSSNTKEPCYWCNGTGKVKYYYGENELEAIIDGHENSWYGQCGSCQGTGYASP